jgi:hypothetical protein
MNERGIQWSFISDASTARKLSPKRPMDHARVLYFDLMWW